VAAEFLAERQQTTRIHHAPWPEISAAPPSLRPLPMCSSSTPHHVEAFGLGSNALGHWIVDLRRDHRIGTVAPPCADNQRGE
jgi:hypothetical protein